MSPSSAREGLSYKERIRGKEEFKEIFKTAKRIDKKGLKIYYTPNNRKISRFAVVVGKKIGCSVKRNRIKRVIREVYRRNKNIFEGGVDWIFVPKGKWETVKYQEIERIITDAVIELERGMPFSKKGITKKKE